MMKNILIAGGNSGIGLESARQLTMLGHQVVLLGRDAQKGEAALAELKNNPSKAEFFAADLSTLAGVRTAADALIAAHEKFDVLLHTSGVLMFEDKRTADGLHPFFAVNYLSRYHLTQLLLPLLRKSDSPRVIMLSSHIPLDTQIDFNQFPKFEPFEFQKMTVAIQFGNHHYAAYLRDNQPGILSAVVNAGLAETGIWREFPSEVREKMLASRKANSIPESAKIPVALCVNDGWESGSYWGKVGNPNEFISLQLDTQTTQRVISVCRDLTGA
jgi:NAD(P)-dependent dehydrogenase (short-subunit alcohol dehydrogenase family)